MQAIQGKTQLKTNSGLTFVHPAHKGNYAECQRQIAQAGEQTPTYAQIADIAYETVVQDPNNQYSKEIRQIMRQNWLWGFTGSLFVPKGVYVQDRPIFGSDGLPIMQESELEAKLQAGDSSVRFVEPGFKTGEQTASELAKNPYVIALAGEQGAEQLAEIASNYKNKPVVYSLENVSEPITRVAALDDGYWNLGVRLDVVGDYLGFNWNGHAFGVRASDKVAS